MHTRDLKTRHKSVGLSCSDGAVAAAARVHVPGAQLAIGGGRIAAGRGGAAAAAAAPAPRPLR